MPSINGCNQPPARLYRFAGIGLRVVVRAILFVVDSELLANRAENSCKTFGSPSKKTGHPVKDDRRTVLRRVEVGWSTVLGLFRIQYQALAIDQQVPSRLPARPGVPR